MKAEGLQSGVADLCIMLPGGKVAWLELKTDKGRQSIAQKGFEAKCKRLDHPYALARTLDEAIASTHTMEGLEMTDTLEHREPAIRLSRDLIKASSTMTTMEARYLVDAYYLMQDDRKRAHNQVRAMEEEPHSVIGWLAGQSETLEGQIKRALDSYSDSHPAGAWLKSNYGIGPVIAAGLLAHIDIRKAPTVGHIWRFAGLDPTTKWEKGQKRPFNAELKTLCWKLGQSFMKFSQQGRMRLWRGVSRAQGQVRRPQRGRRLCGAIGRDPGREEIPRRHRRLQASERRQAAAGPDRRPRPPLHGETVPVALAMRLVVHRVR